MIVFWNTVKIESSLHMCVV